MKIGWIVTKQHQYRLILGFLTLSYGFIVFQELRLALVLSQIKFIYDLTVLPNFLETHFSLRLLSNVLDGFSYLKAIIYGTRLSDVLMLISLWMLYSVSLNPFQHKISISLIVLSLIKFIGMIQIFILALSSSNPNYALFLMHALAYGIILIHGLTSVLILSLWIVEYKH